MEPVNKNAELTLMATMAYIAKRAGDVEAALIELAKAKEVNVAIQANPSLQGVLAEISKAGKELDLRKFAVGMADFMEQQGSNGMNLPSPGDFTGFVGQVFDSPMKFMEGFPANTEAAGSFSGGAGAALSKTDQILALAKAAGIDVDGVKIETVVDATQPVTDAEAAKRKTETTTEALQGVDDDVLARSISKALEPFIKNQEAIKAELDTVKKATNGNTAEPASPEGLSSDTTITDPETGSKDPGAFAAFTDDPELEEAVKSDISKGLVTPKNPWGAPGDALGIRVDGGATNPAFSTNRQRNNG
jgi:hypothetical protein